ncbi:MAG: copper chaperone Copz family protein [Acidobacteriota bacterium]|nr:MAG: copper chaperone Copz family protein [Acidobacteriota bacterium]
MSDCCKVVPEPTAATDDRCRRCGEKGRRVLRETMESLLKPEALEHLTDEPYYFDRTPECDVVYFSNEAESYFQKDELKVRVGLKETESPIPLCYCFGHTAESAREEIVSTGRSSVAESITAEVQAGNCSCEVKNPSGKCCLGDVNRAIGEIQKELEPQELIKAPVARSERG